MKQIHILLTLVSLTFSPAIHAAEKHDHDHGDHQHGKKEAGPNGGRVLHSVEPHFEFLITTDRKIRLTPLGEDNKPIALKDQSATAVGGDRSNPTKFVFVKDGESLLSEQPLPAGNDNPPVILQIKPGKDEKPVTERFSVNLADCDTCKHKEYACTCDHDH
jgi:hypothetical protein